MKKGIFCVLVCMLMIVSTIIPVSATTVSEKTSSPQATGNTLYVGGSGPNNYTWIQDAINDASDRDTIFVYDDSSPYYEHVEIHKSIILLGENSETTIIDANKSGSPIYLEANDVTISGFTLQKSGQECYEDAGIYIKNSGGTSDSNNNKIIRNNIINNHHGIYGYKSINNNITDNFFMGNTHGGIFFDTCDLSKIQNNTIIKNTDGVVIYDSKYTQINKNTIDDNYEFGVLFMEFSNVTNFNQITYNSITHHKFGLMLMGKRNTVEYNYIANNSIGMRICAIDLGKRASYNTIQSNTIAYNSEFGLYLETAIWCSISKNNFIRNAVHASFYYEPIFCYFTQMNKFYRNYWDDDNLTTPKIIQGKILCFFWLSMFNFLLNMIFEHIPDIIKPILIDWKNYDWFPTRTPYDIQWVN